MRVKWAVFSYLKENMDNLLNIDHEKVEIDENCSNRFQKSPSCLSIMLAGVREP